MRQKIRIIIHFVTIAAVLWSGQAAAMDSSKTNSANAHKQIKVSQSDSKAVTVPRVHYTQDKQNIVINEEESPEFTIELKSNPTTGYSWFLREYNSKLITPVSHKYLPPQKKLMGASGIELWTFRVNKIGFVVPIQTTLRLFYMRPWQGSDIANQVNFRISTVPQH